MGEELTQLQLIHEKTSNSHVNTNKDDFKTVTTNSTTAAAARAGSFGKVSMSVRNVISWVWKMSYHLKYWTTISNQHSRTFCFCYWSME